MIDLANARRLTALRGLQADRLRRAAATAQARAEALDREIAEANAHIARDHADLDMAGAWCSSPKADAVGLQRALVHGEALAVVLAGRLAARAELALRRSEALADLAQRQAEHARAERRRQALSEIVETAERDQRRQDARRWDVQAEGRSAGPAQQHREALP